MTGKKGPKAPGRGLRPHPLPLAGKGNLEAVGRLIAETKRTSHILVEVKSGERIVATFEGVAYKA